VQLVDPVHERQICGTHRARRVVRTGSADADQLDLADNRQGVGFTSFSVDTSCSVRTQDAMCAQCTLTLKVTAVTRFPIQVTDA
jgi:hypothetical protein